MKKIILSSTSPARKHLLERLQLPFTIIAPDIDETPLAHETPKELVLRLAISKAKVHASQFPNSLVIGCDQVGILNNKIVSKPETHANAVEQLLHSSNKKIRFYTGLCLLNTQTNRLQKAVEIFDVYYRNLTLEIIENYLRKEKPYHCAGSLKVEGLGIALIKRLSGKDPTALTGLPLICLVSMLEKENVALLSS